MEITELTRIGYGLYLTILSIMDVSSTKNTGLAAGSGGCRCCCSESVPDRSTVLSRTRGALVGIVFLVISRATREAFGYGDSLVIVEWEFFSAFGTLRGY